MQLLKFQTKGNSKLNKLIASFSLISGHTCPFARDCLAKVSRCGKELITGSKAIFRCFSASQEKQYPQTRAARFYNFDLLQEVRKRFQNWHGINKSNAIVDAMVSLISYSMRGIKQRIIRIHVAGDFFCQEYFDAWIRVAMMFPDKTFYAYTKALPFWIKRFDVIPPNFKLTASEGGTHDHLIAKHNLKFAKVVFSTEEAKKLHLPLDHDDKLAYGSDKSFALLLHGTQPKGTEASKAWAKIKKNEGGYNRKKK